MSDGEVNREQVACGFLTSRPSRQNAPLIRSHLCHIMFTSHDNVLTFISEIASHVCGDQDRNMKPKWDVFLSLTRCVF